MFLLLLQHSGQWKMDYEKMGIMAPEKMPLKQQWIGFGWSMRRKGHMTEIAHLLRGPNQVDGAMSQFLLRRVFPKITLLDPFAMDEAANSEFISFCAGGCRPKKTSAAQSRWNNCGRLVLR